MEDTQGHRRTPPLPVLKGTGNRGDVLETPFRQKTADLQVRIDSFLQAPKEFENESVFENNGRVALLGPHDRWFQGSIAGIEDKPECPRGSGH